MHPLSALPRAWWFSELKTLRPAGLGYGRFDLDAQPKISLAGGDLSWLEPEPEKPEWGINGAEAYPEQPLTAEALDRLCGSLEVPQTLRVLASRPDLQRRIRSATACYLDLGHFLVPTSVAGGYLLHLVSDQQDTFHWLLYVDDEGNEGVVGTAETLGFDYSDEPEWKARQLEGIPLDGSGGLDLCADTFDEFLYRFWVENEIFYALVGEQPMSGAIQAYADALKGA